jgi:hypothetical protein
MERLSEAPESIGMEAAFLPVLRAASCIGLRVWRRGISRSASRFGIGECFDWSARLASIAPLPRFAAALQPGIRSTPPSRKRNSASLPHAVLLSPSMARRRPRVGLVVRRFKPRFFLLAALVAVNRSCWPALHAPANAAVNRDGHVIGDSGG